MTNNNKNVFAKYIPEAAVDYCWNIWQTHQFKFTITKPRNSKLGDYSYQLLNGHTITVNGNLNPYAFMVTYLHEVAHMLVRKKYIRRKLPHGQEWKDTFVEVLKPVMHPLILPKDIIAALESYCKNPTASTGGHKLLSTTLRKYDPETSQNLLTLDKLNLGELFLLNKKVFQKGELRRTRYYCTEVKTNKKFLVIGTAPVSKIEQ